MRSLGAVNNRSVTNTNEYRLLLTRLAKYGCTVSELAVAAVQLVPVSDSRWAAKTENPLRAGSGLRSQPHLREATHEDFGSAADSGTHNIKLPHVLEDTQDTDCIFTSMRRASTLATHKRHLSRCPQLYCLPCSTVAQGPGAGPPPRDRLLLCMHKVAVGQTTWNHDGNAYVRRDADENGCKPSQAGRLRIERKVQNL